MDFLKDLFGTPKGPQVLPGAQAQPSKGSDIAQILARTLGAAGAGMGAAQGQPQQMPAWLSKMNSPAPMQSPGGSSFNKGDTIRGLLSRIFGVSNPIAPAQPPIAPNPQLPSAGIQGGTGGLY